MSDSPLCEHARVTLLHPWELLRKYVCTDCGAVMTCACSSDIARYVLPHQALRGADPVTQREVAVTDPLVEGVCFDCRNEPAPAYPKAALRGASSIVHRYYWVELYTMTQERFLDWCRANDLDLLDEGGAPLLPTHVGAHRDIYEGIAAEVLAELREQHATSPKYQVSELSAAEVLTRAGVEVVDYPARYLTPASGKKSLVVPTASEDPAEAATVEGYVISSHQAAGREAIEMESRPLQFLFGLFMWTWVEDPADELSQWVTFMRPVDDEPDESSDRDPATVASEVVHLHSPRDFGGEHYAERRREALNEHLRLIPADPTELEWLFDYWLEPSLPLRRYLWAAGLQDEQRARVLMRVLGPERLKDVLVFLARSYWARYCGWPDLLTWRETAAGPVEVMFVEVKSSGDRLSQDQREWVTANADHLGLPFQVAKVHKSATLDVGGTAT